MSALRSSIGHQVASRRSAIAAILENGVTLQLEGDSVGGFTGRRKRGGSVIGRLLLPPGTTAWFEASVTLTASECRELAWLVRRIEPARQRLVLRGEGRRPRYLPAPRARVMPPALAPILAELGIRHEDCRARGLLPYAEPDRLCLVGVDRLGRRHWLTRPAARAFLALRAAARRDGIVLEIVSSFRSVWHQAEIFRRKLGRGIPLQAILAVNAPPGFSEHHSGRALDLGTPGCPPAEEAFEHTPAFRWLSEHAGRFGFRMSYPRGNVQGFVYEPWHWCFASGP